MKKSVHIISIMFIGAIIALAATLPVTNAERYYFGAKNEIVMEALKKQGDNLPEILRAIATSVGASQHWTGTQAQANDTIRNAILGALDIAPPANYDAEVTEVDRRAEVLRRQLEAIVADDGTRIYGDAVIDQLIAKFKTDYRKAVE